MIGQVTVVAVAAPNVGLEDGQAGPRAIGAAEE